LASYLFYHVEYRRRLKDLWQQAQKYLNNRLSPTLSYLRQAYGLQCHMSLERWQEGPGQLVGAAAVSQVEAAFVPGVLQPRDGPGPQYCVGQRIFKGLGWDDVLLTPFYDLPGRVAGFMFLGRRGVNPADQVFHALERRQGQGQKYRPYEAGLAWLPQLCRDSPDREFLAISDPWLALRLQLRHFQGFSTPLPLTVWHDGPAGRTSRQAWQILEGRRVVIWSWQLDHRAVYQAIQANADIALAGPEEPTARSLAHYARQHIPIDLVRRILSRARPWREALGRWARDASEGAIEELLLNLESYGVDVADLCRSSPALRCGKWCQPSRLPEKVVLLDGRRFIERSDGWYHCTKDHKFLKIVDGVIRVERVEATENPQGQIYHGKVLFRGELIPFRVKLGPRYRLARAVKDMLLHQDKGVLYLSIHYHKYLEELALLFSPLQRPTSQ